MAIFDTSTVAAGVTRHDYNHGYVIEGEQEAIIKAGLAKSDWFADGSGRTKRGQVVRSKYFTIDGRRVQTITRQRSKVCAIRVDFSKAEIEARIEAENAAYAQAEKEAKARSEVPIGRDEYIGQLRRYFDWTMQLAAGGHSWKLPESDHEKLVELAARVNAIISNVRPLPMGAPALRLVANSADEAAFQKFIGRVVGSPPSPPPGA